MNCVVCGKEFTPASPTTVCCSEACKKVRHKGQMMMWGKDHYRYVRGVGYVKKRKSLLSPDEREDAIKLLIMLSDAAKEYPDKKPNINLDLLRGAWSEIKRKRLVVMR